MFLIEHDAALRLTLARQMEADRYRVDHAKDGEEGGHRVAGALRGMRFKVKVRILNLP
ncbi:hypothetical protein [Polaromonas jejuensis]|uniref:hypothetical protein n=1 Tax=Polaromonas jejuensis TaxID=457502 RepID=UPI00366DA5BE